MMFACAIALLLIISSNLESDMYGAMVEIKDSIRDTTVILRRLASVLFTGLLLFVNLQLWDENVRKRLGTGKYTLVFQIIGALFIPLLYTVLYWGLGTEDFIKEKEFTLWMGLNMILILTAFVVGKIKNEENFVGYTITVLTAGIKAFIYSGVLFIGLSSILFTLDKLFELDINSRWYEYSIYITFIPFFMGIFLSSYPYTDSLRGEYRMAKAFRVLLTAIVVPLVIVYTVILYAYCAKILLTWEWPKGVVGSLTLWYGFISAIVLFFLAPIQKENPFILKFRKSYPLVILPMTVVMFMALSLRIGEYGITSMRYTVLMTGVFVVLSMLYYKWKPNSQNLPIPLMLAAIILIVSVGPFSGYHMERRSQNRRFEKILTENAMLRDGKIVPREDLDEKTRIEISRIVRHLDRGFEDSEVPLLPEGYESSDFKQTFGFVETFSSSMDVDEENEIEKYSYYRENLIYDIKGYEKAALVDLSVYDRAETKDEETVAFRDEKIYLKFYDGSKQIDEAVLELDVLRDTLKEIQKKTGKALVIKGSTQKVDYGLYIEDVYMFYDIRNDEYQSINMRADLYYKIKE